MTRALPKWVAGLLAALATLLLLAWVFDAPLRPISVLHWHVTSAVALLLLETALIAGLVIQQRRRVRVEHALRESEGRFHVMADSAPVLLWRSGADKLRDFFNRPWLLFTGRTMAQELGEGWTQGVWAGDLEQCRKTYIESFDARRPFRMEYRLRHADGTYRWLLDSGEPRYGPDGSFAGYVGSCVDITEIREAEARIHEDKERYALATTAGGVGWWDWNLLTNQIYVDPQIKALLGFADGEIPDHLDAWLTIIHPEDADTVAGVIRTLHSGSPAFEVEYRMRHKDGSSRWFLTRGSTMKACDGTPCRAVGTNLDITERKLSSERLRLVMEAVPAGMLLADSEGIIRLVNSHLERLFGYRREELIGQAVELLVPVGFRDEHVQRRQAFTHNPRPQGIGPNSGTFGLHRNGAEIPIAIELNPLQTPEGDFVLGSISDITERKRAEHETQELMTRLRHLAGSLIQAQEAERARIARDLHDDVSQQLAGLSIALSSLKRHVGAGAMTDEGMQTEIASLQQRAAGLADNVRRLSHDLHPAVLQHMGLEAALSAHCRDIQEGHVVRVTFLADGDTTTISRPAALCLYRTAQEGLRNVVQHAHARQAEVRLSCTPDGAEMTIGDDGIGFDIKAARSSTGGMGLISIRERVRLLGGAVSVVTQSGKGTRIIVRMPISDQSSAAEHIAEPDASVF